MRKPIIIPTHKYTITFSSSLERDDEEREIYAERFVELSGNYLKLDGITIALYYRTDNRWYILGDPSDDIGWKHINIS